MTVEIALITIITMTYVVIGHVNKVKAAFCEKPFEMHFYGFRPGIRRAYSPVFIHIVAVISVLTANLNAGVAAFPCIPI